jgi:DNA-binding Lrp family transcriptional regulator
MTEYTFENNALYRYIPIDANTEKRELVITKDEFLMCYIKWICPELLNQDAEKEINKKAKMVVILEELKKSIEDKVYNVSAYNECLDCDVIDYEDVNEIIQEKINALKENKDADTIIEADREVNNGND